MLLDFRFTPRKITINTWQHQNYITVGHFIDSVDHLGICIHELSGKIYLIDWKSDNDSVYVNSNIKNLLAFFVVYLDYKQRIDDLSGRNSMDFSVMTMQDAMKHQLRVRKEAFDLFTTIESELRQIDASAVDSEKEEIVLYWIEEIGEALVYMF